MTNKEVLIELNKYAKNQSTCIKAQVGSGIMTNSAYTSLKYIDKWLPQIWLSRGYNMSMPEDCKKVGCHRMRVYGENSKEHRLPSDCYALHSEINAICTAARAPFVSGLFGTVMFVTRYPCEACARAIVAAGIQRVIYGGIEEISAQTKQIFELGNVEVIYIPIAWGGDTVD